jgi:hypothetical protein
MKQHAILTGTPIQINSLLAKRFYVLSNQTDIGQDVWNKIKEK